MTVLQRTDLTTSQKIECAAAAVARQHEHGSKTALSETYEISRPTVYAVGATAQSVLRAHFEAPLLGGARVTVRVDDAQLCRAVVALRVLAPNAIRPIEDLLPVLYPGVQVSYGTIQAMLVEAEARAGRLNAQAPLVGIEAGALDEMFSQGEPVLSARTLCDGAVVTVFDGRRPRTGTMGAGCRRAVSRLTATGRSPDPLSPRMRCAWSRDAGNPFRFPFPPTPKG